MVIGEIDLKSLCKICGDFELYELLLKGDLDEILLWRTRGFYNDPCEARMSQLTHQEGSNDKIDDKTQRRT